jgi:GxxExxY protein
MQWGFRDLRPLKCSLAGIFHAKGATMDEDELSYKIIGVALQFHKKYGPGLLESAYETALSYDLMEIGPQPFVYKGVKMDAGYRIDLLVNDKVIVETKAIEALAPVHFAQVLTYLKLSNLKLALLINFNVKTLKEHIHRIVNNL